jgi:anti-sigma regulatory factor (Ser/Thr protein kinase)
VTRRLELTLPAVAASVRDARNTVAAIAADLGAGERLVEDVRLCVSEATTNVVRHAYDVRGGGVNVVVRHENGELFVTVDDEGVGLSEFRRDGELGHGLRIIELLADWCSFSSGVSKGTHVEMAFKLNGGGMRTDRIV